MTFEEWWQANRQGLSDKSRKNAAKIIWEAGYTQSRHDVLDNVKRMSKKLFGKEYE